MDRGARSAFAGGECRGGGGFGRPEGWGDFGGALRVRALFVAAPTAALLFAASEGCGVLGGARRVRALAGGSLPSTLGGRASFGGPGAGPRAPRGLASGDVDVDIARGGPSVVTFGLLTSRDPSGRPKKLFVFCLLPLSCVCSSPRSNVETRPRGGFAGRSPSCRITVPPRPFFRRPPRSFDRAEDLYPFIVFVSILSLRNKCSAFAASASSCAARSSASIAARRVSSAACASAAARA